MYLSWNEKTISDFSEKNIESLYNEGYVFTRKDKGVMQQTRSIRIDLSQFELTSENKRILKKTEGLELQTRLLPSAEYTWEIGKMAKDFYDTKFGEKTFSANKIKELLTNPEKSNFNFLLQYNDFGFVICYESKNLLHYSYPFYDLQSAPKDMGLGMMIRALEYAKEKNKKYVYLGSAQRPSDTYKLQFKGVEWFDGKTWKHDQEELKKILSTI